MLNSNAGTSEKILSDWNTFGFELKETKGDFHSFDVRYKGQEGWLTVRTNNGTVTGSDLNLNGFDRPLGSNNDTPLNSLAEKVLNELNVKY